MIESGNENVYVEIVFWQQEFLSLNVETLINVGVFH